MHKPKNIKTAGFVACGFFLLKDIVKVDDICYNKV